MKKLILLIGLVALSQPLMAQGRLRMDATGRAPGASPQAQSGRNSLQAERDALRAQVFQMFMERAGEKLGLDASGRGRLQKVLLQNEERRRDLGRESKQARLDIQTALQNNASDAELSRMLDKLADLRKRDFENWRTEQAELARVLTPRQRAQFMGLRAELFERVQQMRRDKDRQQRQGNAPEAPPGS